MYIKFIDYKVEKFIATLEKTTISKILRTLDLLRQFGNQIGMPHSKKIKNQLFELRIKGSQEVRIFYTFRKDTATLLHGFLKKSKRIPPNEIKIACQKIKTLDTK